MSDIHHTDRAHGKLDYPYGNVSSDEEILSAVLNALHHNSGVPSDLIRAEVSNGQVVLSGAVPEDYERSLAEKAAASVPGVHGVENQIKLAS